MSRLRRAVRLVGAAVAGLTLAAAPTLSAEASGAPVELDRSSPDSGQQLETPPSQITLVFDQALDNRQVVITTVCGGQPATTGAPVPNPDGRTVAAPLSGIAEAGTCNVVWQVNQQDGTSAGTGSFDFEVAALEVTTTTAPAAAAEADATETTPAPDQADSETAAESSTATDDDSPRVGGPLWLTRFASYVALAALFGGLLVIALAWAEGVEYLVTLRYLRIVWIVGAVATVLTVIFSTAELPGNSLGGALSPASWGDLFDTTPGKALLARLLLVVASGWVAWQPDRVTDPATQLVAVAVPGLAVATYGFSRTGGDAEAFGYIAGAVHVVGAGVWFGGLALLARAVLAGPGEEDLVHAVRGYSRLATPAILATVVGGVIQTWRFDGLSLLNTGHGRLVVLKVIGAGLMIYLGTATRQFAMTRLANADHLDGRMAMRLRRAVTIEAALGLVVFAFTSWMMALDAPQVHAKPFQDTTEYVYVSETTPSPFRVELRLTSTEVGTSGMRLNVFEPTEGISGLTVTFSPPEAAYTTTPKIVITVPLNGAGAAVLPASSGIPFTVAGTWTVDIAALGAASELPTAQARIEITTADSATTSTTTTTTAAS